MESIDIILAKAQNMAKRDLLLELMEEARKEGDTVNHLKYLEKYDSLRTEYNELKTINAHAA